MSDCLTAEILLKGLAHSNNSEDDKVRILEQFVIEGYLTDVKIKEVIFSNRDLYPFFSATCIRYMNDIIAPILNENEYHRIFADTFGYPEKTYLQLFSDTFIESLEIVLPPSKYAANIIPLRLITKAINNVHLLNDYLSFYDIELILPFAYDSVYPNEDVVRHIMSRESELMDLTADKLGFISNHYARLPIIEEDILEPTDPYLYYQYERLLKDTISYILSLSDKNWLKIIGKIDSYPSVFREILGMHETSHGYLVFGDSAHSTKAFFWIICHKHDLECFVQDRVADDLQIFITKHFMTFLKLIDRNISREFLNILGHKFNLEMNWSDTNRMYELIEEFRIHPYFDESY